MHSMLHAVLALALTANLNWTLPLNGPWKFSLGDDARWADPAFDDSRWNEMDLTPAPGAHDPDVGVSGYVTGWAARGHGGGLGYAWYRLALSPQALPGEQLALLGPVLVDSAYQIYLNGKLLGGIGDFSRTPPVPFGIRPVMFTLPRSLGAAGQPVVFAVRVWRGPFDAGDPEGGGMHVAPVIGNVEGIRAAYHVQWLERIRGELPELIPIAMFAALAVLALALAANRRRTRGLLWLAVSLVLTSLIRGNLVTFWCGSFESVHVFEAISGVFLLPMTLGAWIVTWYEWFGIERSLRLPLIVGTLTIVYMACEVIVRSWFYGIAPPWLTTIARTVIIYDRYLLFALLCVVVYRAFQMQANEAMAALPALVFVAVAQFAAELNRLGVPGIWFPVQTGVSLSNYAYALAAFAIFALLLRECGTHKQMRLAEIV